MNRLSSCYFCGDAVDAALEEYPLVASDRFEDVDTDQRIELCPSCRRKLTTVVERVLEAAFDGSREDPAAVDADDVLTDVGDEDVMAATDVQPVNGEAHTESDGDEDDGDFEYQHTAESETADDSSDEDATASTDTDEDDEQRADDATGEDDQRQVEGSERDEPTEAAQSEASGAEDGEQTEAEASAEDVGERAYEKAEFNKVVRLLQNREFPVDIDELTVVAGSAYQIDERTTHAIIDALIERGVVADNGDELVRG